MDCGLPGSSILWIFQARILEWVAISFSRGSSRTRDWTGVSHVTGRLPDVWATNATLSIRPTFSYPAWIISFLFLIFCSRYLHMWKIGPRGGECKETDVSRHLQSTYLLGIALSYCQAPWNQWGSPGYSQCQQTSLPGLDTSPHSSTALAGCGILSRSYNWEAVSWLP